MVQVVPGSEKQYAEPLRDVIRLSREEALRLGHDYVGTEHLLLGIIREGECIAARLLRGLGVDLFKLKLAIECAVRASGGVLTIGNIPQTRQADKAFKLAYLEAGLYKSDIIGTEHLLLALLRDDVSFAAQILCQFGVTYEDVRAAYENRLAKNAKHDTPNATDPISGMTEGEASAMRLLSEAFTAFMALPREHPDEARDFRDAYHRLQDLTAVRIVRRAYPEYWPTHAVPK